MKRWFALVLCLAMALSLLTGCGGKNSGDSGDNGGGNGSGANAEDNSAGAAPEGLDGTTYRVLYSSELSTINYLITGTTAEQTVGANIVDTLLEYDSYGNLKPSLATDWSYDEDTLTWTFTLREGQKWVDKNGSPVGDVTAQDFVDAMKYMLTPEYGSTTIQGVFGIILNAEEYYNGLAGEEGYPEIDFSEVGVKAVDATTLTYTLCEPVPYFLSMLTYVTFMPAYGPLLESEGASFGTSADTIYSNGAFYLETWEPQIRMIYRKNTRNWDADNVHIEAIQRTYNAEATTIGPEMVKRGEIDYASLSSDVVDAWLTDSDTADMVSMERPSIDYNYFYIFNFNVRALNEDFYRDPELTGYTIDDEYEPWNWEIAVNNEAFRQSIRHAISRVATMTVDTGENISPDAFLQNTITPEGFAANNGKDYTSQAALRDIMAADSFDRALAEQYKAQAMQELAGKVTFPVKVLVRYNPSSTNWEKQCVVLEQQLEAVLGADYIDVEVLAGPSDGFLTEVRRSSRYMLLLSNWGADYADPETWTDPFYQRQNADGSYDRGMRYAYLAYAIEDDLGSAGTVKEYFSLVEKAKAITDDIDARYAAFAEAEAYLIDHALAVPYGTSVPDRVVSRMNPWDGQYAAFGVSNNRYKGMSLLDHYLSMDEYEASAAEH